MYKVTISKLISNNIYVFVGILIGLYLCSLLPDVDVMEGPCGPRLAVQNLTKPLKLVLKKPQSNSVTNKQVKLIRPRYYSTELGIKEKLFVGVFTSEDKVNTLTIHINRMIGHLVDRIKYFITAQYKLKSKFNLTGLVGFTDTRQKFRPFQIFKYVGDNFAQDYDFYFFMNDYTFLNVHKLKDIVKRISVSNDVYLGNVVKDSSYCNLDSGILLSNSVLKSVREHLDWCVINAISDDHSENIGRCIHHSIGLSCQGSIQDQRIRSYKVRHFELNEHFIELTNKSEFNRAVTIYPILQADSFYLFNAYFLRERLSAINELILNLSENIKGHWPAGARTGAKPATRFDLPKQFYFNMTHMFFPDDFMNIRIHSKSDLTDINNVIDEVKMNVGHKYKNLQYRRLINGYRTFDLSRGLDYVLDIGFRNMSNGKEMIKRFEVSKPLGKVELIHVPYVTENSRITIILPIEESSINAGLEFLNYYSTFLNRKEKLFLMLVLLYQNSSESKGSKDVFAELKTSVLKLASKYKTDDTKLAWLSVRLPPFKRKYLQLSEYPIIHFAIVDLTLKKIGLENLLLILNVNCEFTTDFLNHVRMNTIINFQIFNSIPFRQYNTKITQYQYFDINKNGGHFDREEYQFISFYGRDYVNARRKSQKQLSIVRTDADINTLLLNNGKEKLRNIFDMFVQFGENLHAMRATEMGLKIKYNEDISKNRCNLFLGNKLQLANLLLTKFQNLIQ